MKTCPICKKKSIITETFWENGKCVLKESCVNMKCKTYSPYVNFSWKVPKE